MYANWCGPCHLLADELEKVDNHFNGGGDGERLRILKLDSDANEAVSTMLDVQGLPTLLFCKNGEIVSRLEGAQSEETLRMMIDWKIFSDEPAAQEAHVIPDGQSCG